MSNNTHHDAHPPPARSQSLLLTPSDTTQARWPPTGSPVTIRLQGRDVFGNVVPCSNATAATALWLLWDGQQMAPSTTNTTTTNTTNTTTQSASSQDHSSSSNPVDPPSATDQLLGLTWRCGSRGGDGGGGGGIGEATFVVSFRATRAGQHTVGLAVAQTGELACSWALAVAPGPWPAPPSAPASMLLDLPFIGFPVTATAGIPLLITLQARDPDGNPLPCDPTWASTAFGLVGQQLATGWVCGPNGTFQATWMPTRAGGCRLEGWVRCGGGEEADEATRVGGGPVMVTVVPGPASPARSTYEAPSLTTAGQPYPIALSLRDAYDNPVAGCPTPGDLALGAVTLEWDGADLPPAALAVTAGGGDCNATTTNSTIATNGTKSLVGGGDDDDDDGVSTNSITAMGSNNSNCSITNSTNITNGTAVCLIAFVPTQAGPHLLSAPRLQGVPLAAPPTHVIVTPASPTAARSTCNATAANTTTTANATLVVRAGGPPVRMLCAVRDRYGNHIPCTAARAANGSTVELRWDGATATTLVRWGCEREGGDDGGRFVVEYGPDPRQCGPHVVVAWMAEGPVANGGTTRVEVVAASSSISPAFKGLLPDAVLPGISWDRWVKWPSVEYKSPLTMRARRVHPHPTIPTLPFFHSSTYILTNRRPACPIAASRSTFALRTTNATATTGTRLNVTLTARDRFGNQVSCPAPPPDTPFPFRLSVSPTTTTTPPLISQPQTDGDDDGWGCEPEGGGRFVDWWMEALGAGGYRVRVDLMPGDDEGDEDAGRGGAVTPGPVNLTLRAGELFIFCRDILLSDVVDDPLLRLLVAGADPAGRPVPCPYADRSPALALIWNGTRISPDESCVMMNGSWLYQLTWNVTGGMVMTGRVVLDGLCVGREDEGSVQGLPAVVRLRDNGDTLLLSLVTSRPLAAPPAITIAGHPVAATPLNSSGTQLEARWTVGPEDCLRWAEGTVLGYWVTPARDVNGDMTMVGLAGSAPQGNGTVRIDCMPPALLSATLTGDGPHADQVLTGGTVTLRFALSEALGRPPAVALAGHLVTARRIAPTSNQASYQPTSADPAGPLGFAIADVVDRAGNALLPEGHSITAATSGVSVVVLERNCTVDGDCGPNGTCLALAGATGVALCQCPPGRSGPRCLTIEGSCTVDPDCAHEAHCLGQAPSRACVCAQGWMGTHCQTPAPGCASDAECQAAGDGMARCLVEEAPARCRCSDGQLSALGSACPPAAPTTSTSSVFLWAGALGGGLTALFSLLLLILALVTPGGGDDVGVGDVDGQEVVMALPAMPPATNDTQRYRRRFRAPPLAQLRAPLLRIPLANGGATTIPQPAAAEGLAPDLLLLVNRGASPAPAAAAAAADDNEDANENDENADLPAGAEMNTNNIINIPGVAMPVSMPLPAAPDQQRVSPVPVVPLPAAAHQQTSTPPPQAVARRALLAVLLADADLDLRPSDPITTTTSAPTAASCCQPHTPSPTGVPAPAASSRHPHAPLSLLSGASDPTAEQAGQRKKRASQGTGSRGQGSSGTRAGDDADGGGDGAAVVMTMQMGPCAPALQPAPAAATDGGVLMQACAAVDDDDDAANGDGGRRDRDMEGPSGCCENNGPQPWSETPRVVGDQEEAKQPGLTPQPPAMPRDPRLPARPRAPTQVQVAALSL
ncbi:hypothetical protein PAPYR_4496 [Paratrimastix pyriformis]|uniref:EGF-like domain-containing protein n=1 Tax=Paratrimastix pyriformis TaxID=342808 RepID=A0ABQ8URU1_9EUKA|nr:hypothetical protein PAPYR_4496 [Paratrimastix pyriformis]